MKQETYRYESLYERIMMLQDLVAQAEVTLLEGTLPPVSKIQREADSVCREVVRLAPDQALALQPLVAEVIGSLDTLVTSLKDYRDGLRRPV